MPAQIASKSIMFNPIHIPWLEQIQTLFIQDFLVDGDAIIVDHYIILSMTTSLGTVNSVNMTCVITAWSS
jgi:hypothetical protein